jgi:hypothetical protein
MSRLIIDWSHSPTYTTTMGVFAGCSLIAVASLGRKLFKRELNLVGWALNLGVLGIVLLITGANTVVNWPLNIPM